MIKDLNKELFFNQIFAILSHKVILFGVFGILRRYSLTSYMHGSRKIYTCMDPEKFMPPPPPNVIS